MKPSIPSAAICEISFAPGLGTISAVLQANHLKRSGRKVIRKIDSKYGLLPTQVMKTRKSDNIVSVYSTEHGRLCPDCGKPPAQCVCRQTRPLAKGDGVVRIARETKGRKGSGVTLITGLPLEAGDLRQLASRLKQRCGSGGTIRAGIIEIQGDQRDFLFEELKKLGYRVKRAGG
jgi:translation initiation factor 1